MNVLKVLLAENDATDCKAIMDYVAMLDDIEIIEVTDTPAATAEAVRDLIPHILLLDLGLKHADDLAITTLQTLRTMQLIYIPYIMIPTFQMSGYVQNTALKWGADYIYPKYQDTLDWQKGVINIIRSLSTIARRKWESTGDSLRIEAEYARKLRERIVDELDKVGISRRNTAARELFIEAILLSIKAPQPHLFLTLSEKHERSEAETVTIMEKAICRAWRSFNTNIDELLENYRGKINIRTGVPEVTQFIDYYAEKMK